MDSLKKISSLHIERLKKEEDEEQWISGEELNTEGESDEEGGGEGKGSKFKSKRRDRTLNLRSHLQMKSKLAASCGHFSPSRGVCPPSPPPALMPPSVSITQDPGSASGEPDPPLNISWKPKRGSIKLPNIDLDALGQDTPHPEETTSNINHLPPVTLTELKMIQESLGHLDLMGNVDSQTTIQGTLGRLDLEGNVDSNTYNCYYVTDSDGSQIMVDDKMAIHEITSDLANRIEQSYMTVHTGMKPGPRAILSTLVNLVKDIVTSYEDPERDGVEVTDACLHTESDDVRYHFQGNYSRPTNTPSDRRQYSYRTHTFRRQFHSKNNVQCRRSNQHWRRSANTPSSERSSGETDNLIRILLRDLDRGRVLDTAGGRQEGTNRSGGGGKTSPEETMTPKSTDETPPVELVFQLDEKLRYQIDEIDSMLQQSSKEISNEETKLSDSDSDVELLDCASRRYLNAVQKKLPRRKADLGFYVRKLKRLDALIRDNNKSNVKLANPLSEKDWEYLLSAPEEKQEQNFGDKSSFSNSEDFLDELPNGF